ncbi:DNA repair and recombination protein RAD26 [Ditylenchus destructor]|nr:DNA repair and recombination protein RAD26 [Ditylenchus destructor]
MSAKNNRLLRLGALLESRNRWLRNEAISALSQSFEDPQLISVLLQYLISTNWDTRVAAASAIGAAFSKWASLDTYEPRNNKSEIPDRLAVIDLQTLVHRYKPLLSCKDELVDNSVTISKQEQRRLIDAHLDLNSDTGISSQSFISDDEIVSTSGTNHSNVHPTNQVDDLKPDLVKLEGDDEHSQENYFPKSFNTLIGNLLHNLLDPCWTTRHGSAIALQKLISSCPSKLHLKQIDAMCARMLETLSLDRFTDWITGSNAVAPVREAISQALCILLVRCGETFPALPVLIFDKIVVLLNMVSTEMWQCRHTALIFIKYYFAICSYSKDFEPLFRHVTSVSLDDPVDEVVSMAILSLASLFTNPSFETEHKTPLIREVIVKVWAILQNNEQQARLREGVDSLLVDLLNILEVWLKTDDSAQLNCSQFRVIAELIDQRFIDRTTVILRCMCLTLDRRFEPGDEEIFQILKSLYRSLLFARYEGAEDLISLIFTTLAKFCSTVDESNFAKVERVQKCIGYWIGCVIYDNKNPEIDVFAHCVEGGASNQNKPIETICGDEIRFLDEQQMNEVLVERKILASRFLAPLLVLLYRSGLTIGDQPFHVSIQLLFLPYLKSTSLYQKMGAALVINSFARAYRKSCVSRSNNEAVPPPNILIKEAETNVTSPTKAYNEVTTSVNLLTNECNEFQQWCLRKGVPANELSSTSQSNGTMENIMTTTYEISQKKLIRAEDLTTLSGRYKYIMGLVKQTKLSIHTNTSRINTLLSSSLFYFGLIPATITPMVRPLMEALDCEANFRVAEDTFYDSFPILLSATASRSPCPHVKIFKQLSMGLNSCDQFAPKIKQRNDPSHSLDILSEIDEFGSKTPEIGTKSRNCQLIVEQLCEQFGDDLFTACPDFKNCIDLSSNDLEVYLVNLEVLRVVLKRRAMLRKHRGDDIGIDKSFPLIFADDQSATDKIMEPMAKHLSSANPAIRYRIARFLADLASINMPIFLNNFYNHLESSCSNIEQDSARCGVMELLARLSHLEDTSIIADTIPLIAPMALAGISDQVESVRKTAAVAFGKLVTLMSLEQTESRLLPSLNDKLAKTYHNNSAFPRVLSNPAALPRLRTIDISGLRESVNLREYQLEGITWLKFLCDFGLNGILADDMGLGKTLQVLSLLAIDSEKDALESSGMGSLIVCPKTLMTHWCNEWNNYFPNKKPMQQWMGNIATKKIKQGSDCIYVASYEDVRNQKVFSDARWNYVILDEGHCIRNPNSQLFKAISSLVSKHRLILSGTPVQNSPADLWALFTFLMPGYLSSKANFQAKYMKAIAACRSPKATEHQIKEGEDALGRLHNRILPFVLRRLKSEVLKELPPKVVQDYPCQLTDIQRQLYTFIVERCSMDEMDEIKKEDALTISKSTTSRFSPLHTLILLRKLVDHPCLVAENLAALPHESLKRHNLYDKRYDLSGKMVALKELLEECQIGGPSPIAADIDDDVGTSSSSNLPEAEVLAKSGQVDHRALIFCQWKSSLELVANYLDTGVFGADINYLRLDGTIPAGERQSVVDRFNTDTSIDVLLLTTHIGGVGLTLTGADVVIFIDHDWNPVKDLQAIDRAHRLGQTKTVNVYRLITQGSIEEKVMRLQKFKTDTADVLVGADNRSITSMAASELKDLLNLDATASSNDASTTEERPKKRAKKDSSVIFGEQDTALTKLEKLWDVSQYEEQYSIESFINEARR